MSFGVCRLCVVPPERRLKSCERETFPLRLRRFLSLKTAFPPSPDRRRRSAAAAAAAFQTDAAASAGCCCSAIINPLMPAEATGAIRGQDTEVSFLGINKTLLDRCEILAI